MSPWSSCASSGSLSCRFFRLRRHNTYLHSSIVQTRAYERTDAGKKQVLRNYPNPLSSLTPHLPVPRIVRMTSWSLFSRPVASCGPTPHLSHLRSPGITLTGRALRDVGLDRVAADGVPRQRRDPGAGRGRLPRHRERGRRGHLGGCVTRAPPQNPLCLCLISCCERAADLRVVRPGFCLRLQRTSCCRRRSAPPPPQRSSPSRCSALVRPTLHRPVSRLRALQGVRPCAACIPTYRSLCQRLVGPHDVSHAALQAKTAPSPARSPGRL